jgi:hypothetical protein
VIHSAARGVVGIDAHGVRECRASLAWWIRAASKAKNDRESSD